MKNFRILYVEPHKSHRVIFSRIFKKYFFEEVTFAENSEEALKVLEEKHFDLILTEMVVPSIGGFELIKTIREMSDYKETPIISFTSLMMRGDRERCLEVGADEYIPKITDTKEFIEIISYYVNYEKHLKDFRKKYKIEMEVIEV